MTTPNDDHIGRFVQRQPISSSITVEAGQVVSPMGKQNFSIVKQVTPLPEDAKPSRPNQVGKKKRVVDGVSEDDSTAFVEEYGEVIGGYEKHLAELYLNGEDEAIDLF